MLQRRDFDSIISFATETCELPRMSRRMLELCARTHRDRACGPMVAKPVRTMKQLFLRSSCQTMQGVVYHPFYYFEAKVDIDDVRSGFHQTQSVSSAVAIAPGGADSLWTADMEIPVDVDFIQTELPEGARQGPLPPFVSEQWLDRAEVQFASHLMRHMRARFFRNYALQAYSIGGENYREFADRCLEMLHELFSREMDGLREVYSRRLELIRERHTGELVSEEFSSAGAALRKREFLRVVSEALDGLFLNSEIHGGPSAADERVRRQPPSDLEEKLAALAVDARRDVAGLIQRYREKAESIDEYAVHPALKDIHVVRSGILWMPRRDPTA